MEAWMSSKYNNCDFSSLYHRGYNRLESADERFLPES